MGIKSCSLWVENMRIQNRDFGMGKSFAFRFGNCRKELNRERNATLYSMKAGGGCGVVPPGRAPSRRSLLSHASITLHTNSVETGSAREEYCIRMWIIITQWISVHGHGNLKISWSYFTNCCFILSETVLFKHEIWINHKSNNSDHSY